VLLHVLHALRTELGVTLCAASIDHGLRPESAEEVRAVGVFASSLRIPFVAKRVEVTRPGASLQARARELRYRALHELAASQSATSIAVGHTQDDQAETVLARLLRGAGLRGLSGISARREDSVVRPLIDCRRDAVRSYAVERGLPFVDDPSNHMRVFERVRIRAELLPQLAAEDPRIVEHLAALSDEATEIDEYLQSLTPELPASGRRFVPAEVVDDLPAPVRIRWLRSWIARETGLTLGRAHLTQIGRLLTGKGEVLLGSGWSVRREPNGLSLNYREHRTTRSNRS
jgi:tRNA(Ile)-lysidine synthase